MDAALLPTALAGHARDRVQVLAGDARVRARVLSRGDAAGVLHDVISTLAPIRSPVMPTKPITRPLRIEATRNATPFALPARPLALARCSSGIKIVTTVARTMNTQSMAAGHDRRGNYRLRFQVDPEGYGKPDAGVDDGGGNRIDQDGANGLWHAVSP